jgi:hypothetical protein
VQPGHEHHQGERLGQEVVGPGVEHLGLVVLAVLRREHQNRRPDPLVPQAAAHPVAVHAGQQQVEHDRTVGVLPGAPQPVVAVMDHVDVEAVGRQPPGQRPCQVHLVLHHENPHGTSLADP